MYKRLKTGMISIAILATANIALARIPPRGTLIHDGTEVKRCLGVSDYKDVIQTYEDEAHFREQYDRQKDIINEQKSIILDYGKITRNQEKTIDLLNSENHRLYDLWKEENKKRHLAENKVTIGGIAGWVSAGLFAALAVGMYVK